MTITIQKFRRCTRCGKYGSAEKDFHRKTEGRNGLRTFCKVCISELNRKYRETHPQKSSKEYQRAWRAAHPDYYRLYREQRKKVTGAK
ncbi:hypothetical protein [Paraburkholderia sediminicola]|uniref:hypothetical protein n=1 Tax=Paraburkholderia sediminicola TaxID=458836 RepID=UPI0038B95962